MRTLKADIIECAKGYQAECAPLPGWTAYTKVYRTVEECEQAVDRLAKRLCCSEVKIGMPGPPLDTPPPKD